MVQRDRSHPCVIVWSLGNEAGDAPIHDAMTAWIHRTDPSRPVQYEGGFTFDLDAAAIGERHRLPDVCVAAAHPPHGPTPAATPRRPLILCEYSHAMGQAGGLADYWALFDTVPGLQGGFVWEWCDHGLRRREPDGTEWFAYGGDFGETDHDGSFICDGLVSPDREPHPLLLELAALTQPVRVTPDPRRSTADREPPLVHRPRRPRGALDRGGRRTQDRRRRKLPLAESGHANTSSCRTRSIRIGRRSTHAGEATLTVEFRPVAPRVGRPVAGWRRASNCLLGHARRGIDAASGFDPPGAIRRCRSRSTTTRLIVGDGELRGRVARHCRCSAHPPTTTRHPATARTPRRTDGERWASTTCASRTAAASEHDAGLTRHDLSRSSRVGSCTPSDSDRTDDAIEISDEVDAARHVRRRALGCGDRRFRHASDAVRRPVVVRPRPRRQLSRSSGRGQARSVADARSRDQAVPFVVPQEFGLHLDTRWFTDRQRHHGAHGHAVDADGILGAARVRSTTWPRPTHPHHLPDRTGHVRPSRRGPPRPRHRGVRAGHRRTLADRARHRTAGAGTVSAASGAPPRAGGEPNSTTLRTSLMPAGRDTRRVAPARDPRVARPRRRTGEHRARRVPLGRRAERRAHRHRRHGDAARIGRADARGRPAGPRLPPAQIAPARVAADDRHRHRVRRVHRLLAVRPHRADRHDEPERRRRQRVPPDRAGAAPGDGARRATHRAVRPLQPDRHAARRVRRGARVPSGLGEPTLRDRRHHRAAVRVRRLRADRCGRADPLPPPVAGGRARRLGPARAAVRSDRRSRPSTDSPRCSASTPSAVVSSSPRCSCCGCSAASTCRSR